MSEPTIHHHGRADAQLVAVDAEGVQVVAYIDGGAPRAALASAIADLRREAGWALEGLNSTEAARRSDQTLQEALPDGA